MNREGRMQLPERRARRLSLESLERCRPCELDAALIEPMFRGYLLSQQSGALALVLAGS
jgi:hypothetical protein